MKLVGASNNKAIGRRIGALSDALRQWIEYQAGIRPPRAPAPSAEAEPQPGPSLNAAKPADDDRRARARANFRRLVRTGIFRNCTLLGLTSTWCFHILSVPGASPELRGGESEWTHLTPLASFMKSLATL